MTTDQAATAWESMLIDANGTAPAVSGRGTLRAHGVATLRTTVLLVLAAVLILVLLPALAAQAAPAA